MKAAFLTGIKKFEIRDVPKPAIKNADDVLIRLKSIGVCGSDIHYYLDGKIGSQVVEFPFIIGHECSGTVEETGDEVSGVKKGERVAIDPAISCGRCEECISGRENVCKQIKFLGCPGQIEGCLKEFLIMPEKNLYPLPDGLSFEDGVMLEPLAIAVYAVMLSQLRNGETIAVLGSGPLGLLTLEAAILQGASLSFASDRVDERVDMASRFGANFSFNYNTTDVVEEILERTDGHGVDIAFECAGEQATIDQGIQILKPDGRFLLIGIPRLDKVSFMPHLMRRKELLIQNVRRQNRTVDEAIDLAKRGKIDLKKYVTHRFTLDEVGQAYDLVSNYRGGVIKAIINL